MLSEEHHNQMDEATKKREKSRLRVRRLFLAVSLLLLGVMVAENQTHKDSANLPKIMRPITPPNSPSLLDSGLIKITPTKSFNLRANASTLTRTQAPQSQTATVEPTNEVVKSTSQPTEAELHVHVDVPVTQTPTTEAKTTLEQDLVTPPALTSTLSPESQAPQEAAPPSPTSVPTLRYTGDPDIDNQLRLAAQDPEFQKEFAAIQDKPQQWLDVQKADLTAAELVEAVPNYPLTTEFKTIIQAAADKYGVPWRVLAGILAVEGGGGVMGKELTGYASGSTLSMETQVKYIINGYTLKDCMPSEGLALGVGQLTNFSFDMYKAGAGRTNPDRCNLIDSMNMLAFKVKTEALLIQLADSKRDDKDYDGRKVRNSDSLHAIIVSMGPDFIAKLPITDRRFFYEGMERQLGDGSIYFGRLGGTYSDFIDRYDRGGAVDGILARSLVTADNLRDIVSMSPTQMREALTALNDGGTPVILPTELQLSQLFRQGKEKGTTPNTFIVVGDSMSASELFMKPFAKPGSYDLGTYTDLAKTISAFQTSFSNRAASARQGFKSIDIQKQGSTKNGCEVGESILSCDLRKNNPQYTLMMFGANDVGSLTIEHYTEAMDANIREALDHGSIPILTTVATSYSDDSYKGRKIMQFNLAVVKLGQKHGVPVINLWGDVQLLKDKGVGYDKFHPTEAFPRFNQKGLQYGQVRHSFWTLMTLDKLSQIKESMMLNAMAN